jgi:hypothetical protein
MKRLSITLLMLLGFNMMVNAESDLSGEYIHSGPVCVNDGFDAEGNERLNCNPRSRDTLIIKETGENLYHVSIKTLGTKLHTCFFQNEFKRVEDTLVPVNTILVPPSYGDNRSPVISPIENDEELEEFSITLTINDGDISVSSAYSNRFCGTRAGMNWVYKK